MAKLRDFMDPSLATCAPDTPVSHVARMMRDRNIGDVLIMDNAQLRGIITDRDIAVRVVAGGDNPDQVPVKNYMSAHVVTARPDWDLKQAAGVMGHHQIRRLPIAENDRVIGIVSLGDIALRLGDKSMVGESLKEVSEGAAAHRTGSNRLGRTLMTVGLMALAGTALTVFLTGKSSRDLQQRLKESGLPDTARDVTRQARGKWAEAGVRDTASGLTRQARSKLDDTGWRDTARGVTDQARGKIEETQWRDAVRSALREVSDRLDAVSKMV